MAISKETCVPASPARRQNIAPHARIPLSSIYVILFLSFVPIASAQTSTQQSVYLSLPNTPSSRISGFTKTSQTGVLSSIVGSPFPNRLEGGLVAIDGQGKFLFILNPQSNDISMFQIDQTSAALTEVSGSPFAVPPSVNPNQAPSQPISIASESSGKFLFVGYLSGDFPGDSAVVSLSINTSGSAPVVATIQSIDLNNGGAPIQLLTDPKGLHLYVGLGTNTMTVGGADVYSIDSSSGTLAFEGTADSVPDSGLSYALDPRDRFFFAGGRAGSGGFLESCLVSPVNGTASTCLPLLFLDSGDVPTAMVTGNSGQFLYIALSQSTGNAVAVYNVDQTTGALTQTLAPLTGIAFANGSTVADPMGPFIYSAQFATPAVIHAYQVDQQTGNLTEVFGSPFSSGGTASCCGGLAISGNPAQAVSGPAVSIFPSTANFSSVVGTTSSTQVFSIINTGNQLLAINSISITGANASSFSQSNTCLSTLAPNANCSVSITFTPASVGTLTATLQVADNAPGAPQTLILNGTGFSALPAMTLSPAVPSFPTTTQGTSSSAQTLAVTNSGTAPLTISSVSLGGSNASDFSLSNNCTAPIAVASTCTISLIFNPIAPGQRTADLLISDNVPGSPQTVSLSGTAVGAFSVAAASGSSTTASVSAGQTAQYQLQLTPGTGFSGAVSLTCTGAPLGAVCQLPANVSLASGAPTTFTVSVSTSGPAFLPPSTPLRVPPVSTLPLLAPLLLILLLSFFLWFHRRGGSLDNATARNRLAFCGAIFCITLSLAGCGGGSAAVTPPRPMVTPSGTSTLTIALSANSSTGQPLQLQPIQLTLIVN